MINGMMRLGVNRGLFGGSRVFRAIGAFAAFVRVLQRISKTGPRTLMTHTLKPGEVVIIKEPARRRK